MSATAISHARPALPPRRTFVSVAVFLVLAANLRMAVVAFPRLSIWSKQIWT